MGVADEIDDDDEGGSIFRRRKKKKRRVTRKVAPRPPARVVAPRVLQPQQAMISAIAEAQAYASAEDNSRPNRLYGLTTTDPTVAVLTTATASGEITLNDDSWVQWIGCVDVDAENFLLTSFKVNSFDIVGGGKVNLAGFLAWVNRKDRPTPLIGRRFNGQTKISFTVQNITGASALFRGFTILVNEPVCKNDMKNSTIAPSVLNFGRLVSTMRPAIKTVQRRPGLLFGR